MESKDEEKLKKIKNRYRNVTIEQGIKSKYIAGCDLERIQMVEDVKDLLEIIDSYELK